MLNDREKQQFMSCQIQLANCGTQYL